MKLHWERLAEPKSWWILIGLFVLLNLVAAGLMTWAMWLWG